MLMGLVGMRGIGFLEQLFGGLLRVNLAPVAVGLHCPLDGLNALAALSFAAAGAAFRPRAVGAAR